MTDEDLVRRFAERRDEDAFRELYRRHTPRVYGLLVRLTANSSDAADLMQDAWLRAASAVGGFRGESAFRTWLTGIALNCVREWLRGQVRRRTMEGDDRVNAAPGREPPAPGAGAAAIERHLDTQRTLGRVSPDHRAVLVLHDVEGYTHEEVAGALGIEIGTSKSRLSRARESFRALWLMDSGE